jgi:four helix bundle protein
MAKSILAMKSLDFGIRVVRCVQYLQKEKNEYILSKQVLRSGTSIGANIHEGLYAQSKADFVSKLTISLKEASETSYWLILLNKTDYLTQEIYESLKLDVDELIRMIIASLKTTKCNEKDS